MKVDDLKSKIDAGCKLYLQPVGLGGEGEVLAGGWQRFLGLRLTLKSIDGMIESEVFSLAEFKPFLNIPALHTLYTNLTFSRAEFGGLAMNRPHLMGILNATPDSFSDGGDNYQVEQAVEQGLKMVADGATILDIGGESTRPGAEVVSAETEISRVLPVIEALRAKTSCAISIDTRNPQTMKAALASGADFINDVTALEHSEKSLEVAREHKKPVFLMHMKGQPKNMQNSPTYSSVVLDVYDYLEGRLKACEAVGLERSQIATDVGIGFGKTLKHNMDLIANLSLFHALGAPILLGASRKSFIEKIVESTKPKERLPGSLVAMVNGLHNGVQMIRVHDVKDSMQAVRVWQAIRNN